MTCRVRSSLPSPSLSMPALFEAMVRSLTPLAGSRRSAAPGCRTGRSRPRRWSCRRTAARRARPRHWDRFSASDFLGRGSAVRRASRVKRVSGAAAAKPRAGCGLGAGRSSAARKRPRHRRSAACRRPTSTPPAPSPTWSAKPFGSALPPSAWPAAKRLAREAAAAPDRGERFAVSTPPSAALQRAVDDHVAARSMSAACAVKVGASINGCAILQNDQGVGDRPASARMRG